MSASTPLLSLKGITKIFPGVRALENVQLDLWPGKVTALIGENGAGKSTLVKVMTGIYQPEEGEILYKAIPIHLPTPESAHKVGITAIHQGKIGKVYVTGLGLPSEMAGAIKSGASKSFAIWNPIDLGYAATYLADDLVKGTATKTEASMGKLGKVKLDAEGNGAMAKPFVYDANNIDKFSKIF